MESNEVRRLFAFHHAGGGTTTFLGWQRGLGPSVEVIPVRLPRSGVADLADALLPLLRPPYLFYGHSTGAIVAHRVAGLLRARGRTGPRRLLVGASAAPHRAPGVIRALGDLRQLVPPAPPSVRERMLDAVRRDLALCADPAPAGPVLTCPIDVFTGTDDPLVGSSDAAGWARYTDAECRVHSVPGGHFFHRRPDRRFLDHLRALAHGDPADGAVAREGVRRQLIP